MEAALKLQQITQIYCMQCHYILTNEIQELWSVEHQENQRSNETYMQGHASSILPYKLAWNKANCNVQSIINNVTE